MLRLKHTMIYIVLIVVIEVILFLANYSYATYLVGWDTVMPEFNLGLNFKRALLSVWQEYRGLGLLDGMAHSANLMHTVYIWILSLLIPQSVLRYVFINLTHAFGGVGMYLLAKRLTGSPKASFVGALFYMFNIGVIQMYYAPLEVFSIHFAALPWLCLAVTRALESPTRKRLAVLFLTSIAFSSQGFVPTVFIAFLVIFGFILGFAHKGKGSIKSIVLVGFIVFASNAFWIIPYGYSALQNASVIQNTRINQFSSEEIYYRNKARGDIVSVFSFKGFMLDSNEYDTEKRGYTYFMDTWREHTSSLQYSIVYLGLAGVGGVGIFGIIKRRKSVLYPYVGALVVSFAFLANNTIGFEQFNMLLRAFFPILGEAFRFPFTKFIILFAFCFSVLLAYGISVLFDLYDKFAPHPNPLPRGERERGNAGEGVQAQAIPFYICLVVIMFLAYPAFTGHFFSPYVKLSIPQEYFETISYFQKQNPNQRIALLPTHTFWNWQYTDWGFRGSGFLWYGIPQPLLLRAFDPWSNYNEQFYNELSYALQRKDEEQLEATLRKYDVSYLLLDQHVVNTLSTQPINYDSLTQFLSEAPFLRQEKAFGKIIMYKTTFSPSWVFTLSSKTPRVASKVLYEKSDTLFQTLGNYIHSEKEPNVTYVFPSLFTEKKQNDIDFSVTQQKDSIIFTPKHPISFSKKHTLEIPSFFKDEFLVPVEISQGIDEILLTPMYPRVYINDVLASFRIEPIILRPSVVKTPHTIEFVDVMKHRVPLSQGQNKSYLLNPYANSIKLIDDQNEEVIVADTTGIDSSGFLIPLENEDIRSFRVEAPKIQSPLSIGDVVRSKSYKVREEVPLLPTFKQTYSYSKVAATSKGLSIDVRGDTTQMIFYKDNLFHEASYVVFANISYVEGLPISFYLDNPYETRPEIEAQLSKERGENVIVIPPTQSYFKGYGFHFIVKSVGNEIAKSTIHSVEVYPFPMQFLKGIRIRESDFVGTQRELKHEVEFSSFGFHVYVLHPNPLPKWERERENAGEGGQAQAKSVFVGISQAYHEGWSAYAIENSKWKIVNSIKRIAPFWFGKKVEDHVVVNSWANGWKIENEKLKMKPFDSAQGESEKLVIVFWPQYLEFVGFLVGIGGLVLLLLVKPRRTSS